MGQSLRSKGPADWLQFFGITQSISFSCQTTDSLPNNDFRCDREEVTFQCSWGAPRNELMRLQIMGRPWIYYNYNYIILIYIDMICHVLLLLVLLVVAVAVAVAVVVVTASFV